MGAVSEKDNDIYWLNEKKTVKFNTSRKYGWREKMKMSRGFYRALYKFIHYYSNSNRFPNVTGSYYQTLMSKLNKFFKALLITCLPRLRLASGKLAIWSKHLTPNLEDVSLNPLCGHEPGSLITLKTNGVQF